MKHVILTLGIFSLGFLTSCDTSTEPEADSKENTEQQDEKVEEHDHGEHDHDHKMEEEHSHDDGSPISLNNEEKWKVNEEMKPFVKQGEKVVFEYAETNDEDYLSLAEELAEQNSHLISSCTMEGESHDELHKWLHPHLELTKDLKEAENIDEANETVEELLASYKEYHEYFE